MVIYIQLKEISKKILHLIFIKNSDFLNGLKIKENRELKACTFKPQLNPVPTYFSGDTYHGNFHLYFL